MKKKHKKKVYEKVNEKNLLFVVFMFALSFYLLFVAFYSHGVVSEDDLEVRAVEIVNVEFHLRGRYGKNWLSFLTSDNETFYCRIEGPNRRAIAELNDKEVLPVSAKVSYGKPDLLLASIITYDNRHRLATLEVDGNMIIDVEHYNTVNSEYRVGFIIASALIILAATFPYWLVWLCSWLVKREKESNTTVPYLDAQDSF